MLFWSAVINGMVAVPIMITLMLVITSAAGRQKFAFPTWLNALGWLASAMMVLVVGLFLAFSLHSSP
jgi:Mn2+/Fe2+ NRAMP family transporter